MSNWHLVNSRNKLQKLTNKPCILGTPILSQLRQYRRLYQLSELMRRMIGRVIIRNKNLSEEIQDNLKSNAKSPTCQSLPENYRMMAPLKNKRPLLKKVVMIKWFQSIKIERQLIEIGGLGMKGRWGRGGLRREKGRGNGTENASKIEKER